MQIIHNDFGAFVIARQILKKHPQAQLEIIIKHGTNFYEKNPVILEKFWKKFPKNSGIFIDRKKNTEFLEIIEGKFPIFPHQSLLSLAYEGLADSVEFRRLARKFLRRAKQANLKNLLVPDLILGAEKIPKILQHLAGTQMKIITIKDLLDEKFLGNFSLENPDLDSNRKISIKIDRSIESDLEFAHKRAEEIMRSKVKKGDVDFLFI